MATTVTRRPARDVGAGDFADITTAAVTAIDWGDRGRLTVTFDADLTAEQIAAVRRRIQSATAAEEQLRERAEAFIAADPAGVTHVQLVQVVQRLARLVLRDDED